MWRPHTRVLGLGAVDRDRTSWIGVGNKREVIICRDSNCFKGQELGTLSHFRGIFQQPRRRKLLTP